MASDWLPAAFGLGGAVVGAMASFGGAGYVERRRDRRAVRTATRVLGQELDDHIQSAQLILKMGAWVPYDFVSPEWEVHRNIAASALEDADWELVSRAYGHVAGLRVDVKFAHDLDVDPDLRGYTEASVAEVRYRLAVLEEARSRLKAIARDA